MFSVIIAILVIGLTGAMAFMAGYYFGNKGFDAKKSAQTTAQINKASQISAAIGMCRSDYRGAVSKDIQTLIDGGYLKSITGDPWQFDENLILNETVDEKTCAQINKRLIGDDGVPSCSSVNNGFMGCCSK